MANITFTTLDKYSRGTPSGSWGKWYTALKAVLNGLDSRLDTLEGPAFQTLTDAATVAMNSSSGWNAQVTLGGNRTLGTPTNTVLGQEGWIKVIQDGTGSRTLAYSAAWSFGNAGAPTLSTAAGKIDLIRYVVVDSAPAIYAIFHKAA